MCRQMEIWGEKPYFEWKPPTIPRIGDKAWINGGRGGVSRASYERVWKRQQWVIRDFERGSNEGWRGHGKRL